MVELQAVYFKNDKFSRLYNWVPSILGNKLKEISKISEGDIRVGSAFEPSGDSTPVIEISLDFDWMNQRCVIQWRAESGKSYGIVRDPSPIFPPL